MTAYYVYRYRDPRSHRLGTPIYIGKGTVCPGAVPYRRAFYYKRRNGSNLLLSRVLAKIERMGLVPIIEIVRVCRTEKQAFRCERYWIKQYGRLSIGTGTLLNLTDGGEGVVGFRFSKVQRAKFKATSDRVWAEHPELKQAQSERSLKVWARPGFKAKRSAEIRAYWAKPVNAKRQSKHGKRLAAERWADPEEHETMSAQTKELWKDPEFRAKIKKGLCAAAQVRANRLSWRRAHSKRIKAYWRRRKAGRREQHN